MSESADKYVNWIADNLDLVRDSTLFVGVKYAHFDYLNGTRAEDRLVRFPSGIVPNNLLRLSELPQLFEQLAVPYVELLAKARDLPAEDADSDIFYRICDAFWERKPPVLEYEKVVDNGTQTEKLFRPPRPVNYHHSMSLKFAFSVAYTHSVLINVAPHKKDCLFKYELGHKQIFPSFRWKELVESDILTIEELRNLGKHYQKLNEKVLKAIRLEETPDSRLMTDLSAYAHNMKNAPRDDSSTLAAICRKLEIDFTCSRRVAESTGRKRLDDPTLFY